MARSRKPASAGDLLRSLVVILIPLLIITAVFTRNPDERPVKEVNWRPVLALARSEAAFPVLAPETLPSGWRPTKASWIQVGQPDLNGAPAVRNTWQFGVLNPDDMYLAVDQGDLQPADFVAEQTRAGSPDGESVVAGTVWQRRISADERTRSLVQSTAAVSTVVSGDVPYSELEAYAATLRPG